MTGEPSGLPNNDRVRVEVLLDDAERRAAFRDAALSGLGATPKRIPSIWLYDETGSRLFDEITRLPEYYLSRTEREILDRHANEIASETHATTLVELGSGTSEKTRLLLDALTAAGTLRSFAPLDVSEEVLLASAYAVAEEYPNITVHAIVGDFERHLSALEAGGRRRLFAFLGSTLGNFEPEGRRRFLEALATSLEPADALLEGLDLVKDAGRIEAAYNDRAGLSERFQRNGLAHFDRELGSGFSRARLEYRAFWDVEREWVDIGFDSVDAQIVQVPKLGIDVELADGERLRTQVSAKFRREAFETELADAGFELARWWTERRLCRVSRSPARVVAALQLSARLVESDWVVLGRGVREVAAACRLAESDGRFGPFWESHWWRCSPRARRRPLVLSPHKRRPRPRSRRPSRSVG